jgi:Tfp pilus assembly protein FimV
MEQSLFRDSVIFKPVCFLYGLCYASVSAAIGLGDINVRSYLGQPFHATVTILGATPDTTADCFSLGAGAGSLAPLPRAQLSVQRSEGNVLLHIRTAQTIREPIAQFVITTDCDTRLQREYVVLLDPPTLAQAGSAQSAADMTQAATPAVTPAPAAKSRTRAKRRTASAAPLSTATSRPSTLPRAQPSPSGDVPRLVLSGRSGMHGDGAVLSLRYDTNLPDLTRPRPERLNPTELSDENTALTRKLAYLEAQLAALQKRNTELDSKRAAATTAAPLPPKQLTRWPLYLLAIGLLTGGSVLAIWLHRRRSGVVQDEAPSTDRDALPALAEDKQTSEAPELLPVQHMAEIPPPPDEASATEVKEDILDQAEVYMAFGHGELAIHLLQEHLREAPSESPVPWLLLLDLLHREGDTAGYTAASAECRRYFNVNLSNYQGPDNEAGQGLEAYTHVLEQLVKAWNTPDINGFFDDLIFDHRGGTRIGFEPDAYRDILLLRTVAQGMQDET